MKNKPGLPVRILHGLETGLLVCILAAMIGLATLQIGLRNLADTGLFWVDPLLRHLVLWIALLGAMVAARSENHLAVDVLTHFLPPRLKAAARVLTCLFTSLVCAALAHSAWVYVGYEREFPLEAFAGVDTWIPALILPVGFAVMAMRYLLHGCRHFWCLVSGRIQGDTC